MYNTRHKAAQRDKQTGKIVGLNGSDNEKDTWETDSQKSAVQEIHTETSDGDISSDNEEHNFLCNETIERHIDATHRETFPSSVVRSQQCNSPIYKDMSQIKNRRKRPHTKTNKGHDTLNSPVTPQAEGEWTDKESNELPKQNNSYLLENFSKIINSALNKMTEAMSSMFKTTIQEASQKQMNKGHTNQTQKVQRGRSTSKSNRLVSRRSPSVTTESDDSESDNKESAHSSSASVCTPDIFHKKTGNLSVKLPAFRGDTDEKWKAYFNRFEAVALHNNWTDKDKLGQLLPRLQGLAGEFVFEELKPEILSNYKQLTKGLGNRFGVIETNRTFQTKFRRRDQKNGELIQSYAAELKSLYSKAYPNRDNLTKQQDLVSRFLLGLSNEKARIHVELNRDPKTIEEATEYIIEYEEATRYPRAEDEPGYFNRKRPTRQVNDKSQISSPLKDNSKHTKGSQPRTNWKDRQDKLKEKSTKSPEQSSSSQHIDKSPYITRDELISAINEALTSRQPSYRGSGQKNKSPITCYRCGEQGHYANSCVSERPLKDNQRGNPLNPRASEFKQTLN